MSAVARLGGRTPGAWWLAILTVGPLLGSFITEPAAMTICALLLARQFYDLGPSTKFRYATLGLLFVNVSVGGTLTHFAAPPVLMVAGKWGWDMAFMFTHFGWIATLGIGISNADLLRRFPPRICHAAPADRCGKAAPPVERPHRSRAAPDHARASRFPRLDGLHRALSGALHRRIPVLPRVHHRHRAPPESARAPARDSSRLLPRRPGDPRRLASLVDRPGPREACPKRRCSSAR